MVLKSRQLGFGAPFRKTTHRFTGTACNMKKLSFFWGMSGIIFILMFAIYRLAPMAVALKDTPLELLHWVALIFSLIYMAYAEGYKGFFLSFAPLR